MRKIYSPEKTIVRFIRSEREYQSLTQSDLAKALKLSQNAYSRIELGITKLTVETLFQIAILLSISDADLLNINLLNQILEQREAQKKRDSILNKI